MKHLLLLALFGTSAFAADDPQKQCTQELTVTRDQRNTAQNEVAAIVANANTQIQALQARIKELEAKK